MLSVSLVLYVCKIFRNVLFALTFLLTTAVLGEGVKPKTCPVNPTKIVVIGDSLAMGLWDSIKRKYLRCGHMEVLNLTKVSDGLARTAPEKWIKKLDAMLNSDDTLALAIVQTGANDLVGIREKKGRANYGTDKWFDLYGDRAQRLVKYLFERTDQVIWVGLPVVGDPKLEKAYKKVSATLELYLGETKAHFIDIHEATEFDTGGFSMSGQFEGKMRKLRTSDRTHFTVSGYRFVVAQFISLIDKTLSAEAQRSVLDDLGLQ